MKHYCPMCGEQWNDDYCAACGWREGKQPRYTSSRKRNGPRKALMVVHPPGCVPKRVAVTIHLWDDK